MKDVQRLNFYILIVRIIQNRPRTFKEILSALEDESSDFKKFDIRSFQRYKKKIYTLFNIDIICEKGVYQINEAESSLYHHKMLESFELYNSLSKVEPLGNIIQPELKCKKGTEYFSVLIKAINNQLKIELQYNSYSKGGIVDEVLEPYCIKESQGRWYLIAVNEKKQVWQYCLDRFVQLKLTRLNFKTTRLLEIEKRYEGSFGIIGGDHFPIQSIVLNFTPFQAQYVRGYPIHVSQEEIGVVEGGFIQFSYNMRVTRDLEMKILSYGATVQVIEPQVLRKTIISETKKVLGYYE